MKPVHVRSAAGAHSTDGKFTSTVQSETASFVKVGARAVPIPVNIPGVSATAVKGKTFGQATVTVRAALNLEQALPSGIDKNRWMSDQAESISAFLPPASQLSPTADSVSYQRNLLTAPDGSLEVQRVISEVIGDELGPVSPQSLSKKVATLGFQGYRKGDDPELLPENLPFDAEYANELTGGQRVAALSFHRSLEDDLKLRVEGGYWGDARLEWCLPDRRYVSVVLNPEGEVKKAQISPDDWESRPWRTPVDYSSHPDFVSMLARVKGHQAKLA